MRNFIVLCLFIFSVSFALQAQVTSTQFADQQKMDSLNTKVMKLMEFYDSYDNGSSETFKKEKYNDAVDEISNGTASQKDKNDAYQIIDTYIKGDKAIGQNGTQQESDDMNKAIEQTDEVRKAQELVNQNKTMLMQMSYSEFESYIQQMNPVAGTREIKQAFNEMHKNDGRQISITSTDNEMNAAQQQMWAFETIQDPENYEDFHKAYKILKTDATEAEIRETWGKIKK